MLPCQATNKHRNKAIADAIFGRQFDLTDTLLSLSQQFDNLGIAYLRRSVGIATAITVPFHSIANVVTRCSDVQMGRVAARRIVAAVKDKMPFWNWTKLQTVRDAMGVLKFLANANLPIAAPFVAMACPIPAASLRVNDQFREESI